MNLGGSAHQSDIRNSSTQIPLRDKLVALVLLKKPTALPNM